MTERNRAILRDELRHVHWTRLERVLIRVLFGVRIDKKKGNR